MRRIVAKIQIRSAAQISRAGSEEKSAQTLEIKKVFFQKVWVRARVKKRTQTFMIFRTPYFNVNPPQKISIKNFISVLKN